MDFKEYQEKALRTAGEYTDGIDQLLNGVMGLNGEAGEVIDIVKKFMYQGHELNKEDIKNEISDCLWYLNLIADSIGESLEHIAEYNISKLEKRYPKGYFRAEDSVNREEVKIEKCKWFKETLKEALDEIEDLYESHGAHSSWVDRIRENIKKHEEE